MPSALRVLTCLHSFELGGVERVALRLCEAWQAEGAQVTVLLGRRDGAMRGPPLDYVTFSSGPFSTAWCETLWMMICLWRQVRRNRPDVIFCPGNTYTVVMVALRLLLRDRCPPIVAKVSNALDRTDMIVPLRLFYCAWLRLQGPMIDTWVGMAEAMRGEIAAAVGVAPERVAIVDDPALSEAEALALARARDRAPQDGLRGRLLIAAGRLAGQKRFDLLLRAFARGAGPDDRLVIVGEGPSRGRLEALVARLGLGRRVRLPGFSPDIGVWLAFADLFVLSSDYEGVPAVIVEALAAGVPILATDCAVSLPDMLGHGRFGRLVAVGDEAGFARALAETPGGDAVGARRHARHFFVEVAGPAYLALLRAAASKGEKRGGAVNDRGVSGGVQDEPAAVAGPGGHELHSVEPVARCGGGALPAERAGTGDPGARGGTEGSGRAAAAGAVSVE